jgi:hypothetical protein
MPLNRRLMGILSLGLLLLAGMAIAKGNEWTETDPDEAFLECREDGDDELVSHCEWHVRTWRATSGEVDVDAGLNGGISVESWDRDSVQVRVRVTAKARSEEKARELARSVTVALGPGKVRAQGPKPTNSAHWWVSYRVRVPRRADLLLRAHNGPLAVRRVSGRIDMDVVNGPAALFELGGDVVCRVTNGPLVVTLAGGRWEGAELDAETVNGPLRLKIPKNYSAMLETGTVNGPLECNYPLTVQGQITKRLSAKLGSGGPRVRVVTTNGPAVIQMQ